MQEAILGILFFCGIVLLLTLFVLGARRLLVPRGECKIEINGRRTVTATIGERLLTVCQDAGILLPSACAGAGTCGLCKVRVLEGGGEAGPQELAQLKLAEVRQGARLACQVGLLGPLEVEVDEVLPGPATRLSPLGRRTEHSGRRIADRTEQIEGGVGVIERWHRLGR